MESAREGLCPGVDGKGLLKEKEALEPELFLNHFYIKSSLFDQCAFCYRFEEAWREAWPTFYVPKFLYPLLSTTRFSNPLRNTLTNTFLNVFIELF